MELGAPELLIILVIVILLFGVGRIAKTAGELGSGVRAFKKGLQGDDEEEDNKPAASKPAASSIVDTPQAATRAFEQSVDTPVVMESDDLPKIVDKEKQS